LRALQGLHQSTSNQDVLAAATLSFVASDIRHDRSKSKDPWQYPEETLAIRSGDCEDKAFLIASMMRALGVPSYNVRVVLGEVNIEDKKRSIRQDHVWVMYKSRRGEWLPLDPYFVGPVSQHEHAVFTPYFIFNDECVWTLHPRDGADRLFSHTKSRQRRHARTLSGEIGTKYNPKWEGNEHQEIVRTALNCVLPPTVVESLTSLHFYTYVAGVPVDKPDVVHYQPHMHFDNGLISEGFSYVGNLLTQVGNSWKSGTSQSDLPTLQLVDFATHAIADFYSHSSYAHFGQIHNDRLTICKPTTADLADFPAYLTRIGCQVPDYSHSVEGEFRFRPTKDDGFDLGYNDAYTYGERYHFTNVWGGRLISGRYGQPYEPPYRMERFATMSEEDFWKLPKWRERTLLPRHDDIAVDCANRPSYHRLYSDSSPMARQIYSNQYRWRKNAAIEHVRQAVQSIVA
jgi:hypothetical protein